MIAVSLSTLIAVAVLAALALATNVRLLFAIRREGRPLPGCGHASGCDAVLASRWSSWVGVPVAVPGATVYLVIFGAVVVCALAGVGRARTVALRAAVTAALIAAGAGAWFIAIQLLALRRFCAYCTLVHLTGIIACGVLLAGHFNRASRVHATLLIDRITVTVAGTCVGALIVGQLLFRPKRYSLTATTTRTPSSDRAVESQIGSAGGDDERLDRAAPRGGGRTVSFMSGKITLSIDDWPVLGSPDARVVVAYLFDYTCPTCRRVHRLLREALEMSGPDTAAVLYVPAPMDPTCNPHARRLTATRAHSCRYARLGLDVWRRRPNLFAEYDRWLFEPPEPPPIGAARTFAQQLVGTADLDPSLPDAELDGLIARGVDTYRVSEAGVMPTLLFAHAVLRGEPPSARHLSSIILRELASD